MWITEVGAPDHFIGLLRKLYVGQVRIGYGKTDWSKLEKKYDKFIYYHLLKSIYMKSTLCKRLSWVNHKAE